AKDESTAKQYYELPNSNVLNPPDQGIDLEGVELDKAWITQLLEKRAFSQDNPIEREIIRSAAGRPALDVALQISLQRYEDEKQAGRIRANQQPPSRPVGAAIRDMRKTSHGLLLLYPLDAADAGLA